MNQTKRKYFSFGSTGSFLEYNQVINHLNPGDLIEIQRRFGYKHWALFHQIDRSGNVWCYHITGAEALLLSGKAILKYEPLKDILKDINDSIPSLCRVNNQDIMAAEMLNIIKNERPDIKQVFKILKRKRNSLVKYDLDVI